MNPLDYLMPHDFGACDSCNGTGDVIEFDPEHPNLPGTLRTCSTCHGTGDSTPGELEEKSSTPT